MTIDTAKELQMNIAKEGLALLVLHPTADVQLHRECISHIGTVWGIPTSDTQEVASLLEREQAAILAAGESGTVTHVLPEEELPMNASGLETLDNIWDLFETTLRADSAYARTCLFEMAKWLEESQNLLDWIEKTPAEKQAWMEQVSCPPTGGAAPQRAAPPVSPAMPPVSRCVRLWGRGWHPCTPDRHRRCLPPLSPRLWGIVLGTCLFDKSTR